MPLITLNYNIIAQIAHIGSGFMGTTIPVIGFKKSLKTTYIVVGSMVVLKEVWDVNGLESEADSGGVSGSIIDTLFYAVGMGLGNFIINRNNNKVEIAASIAASIGNVDILQKTVQDSINEILAERKKVDTTQMQLETGKVLSTSQLQFHLISLLLEEVAKDLKLSVSTAEITKRKQSIITQFGGSSKLPKELVNASIAPKDFDKYIKAVIFGDKISASLTNQGLKEEQIRDRIQKLIVAKANKLEVIVNPQYGKWNTATAELTSIDNVKS